MTSKQLTDWMFGEILPKSKDGEVVKLTDKEFEEFQVCYSKFATYGGGTNLGNAIKKGESFFAEEHDFFIPAGGRVRIVRE